MAKPMIDDALWQKIQPLLPPPKPRRQRYPGRKPIDDRKALTGILFVLKMGIPWEDLPPEMGCGSGMTCWRRLQHWNRTGAWPAVAATLSAELPEADRIDWSRASGDGRAKRGARVPVETEQATAGPEVNIGTEPPPAFSVGAHEQQEPDRAADSFVNVQEATHNGWKEHDPSHETAGSHAGLTP